jgi:hypothetical protein
MEYKYIWIIIGDRAGLYLIGFRPGWQLSEAHIAFVPPVSIKGCSLLWMIVRSQTSYPKHILTYESGKTCYSLVMGSGFFWTDF